MKWMEIFHLMITVTLIALIITPLAPAVTVYLSFVAIALLATLTPMIEKTAQKIFPTFLIAIIAISFMSTTDYVVIPLAVITMFLYSIVIDTGIWYTASVPLILLAIIGQIIVHIQKDVLLAPKQQNVIIALIIMALSTKLQRFVPINLEHLGPGDPRKGRLYNTIKSIPWDDKWPRIAEVKWGPPNPDDVTPAYTDGEYSIYSPHIENGKMSFITINEGKIIRITTTSPDISWFKNGSKAPNDVKIEYIAEIKGFKPSKVISSGDRVIAFDDGIKIEYTSGDNSITVQSSDTKLEISLEEMKKLSWNDVKTFLCF